jgi:hypothetical protein
VRAWAALPPAFKAEVLHAANNISLPEPRLAEIQSAAQAEHISVDEVLTDAVKRYVENRSRAKLLGYGAERAKALGIIESDIDQLIAEPGVADRRDSSMTGSEVHDLPRPEVAEQMIRLHAKLRSWSAGPP